MAQKTTAAKSPSTLPLISGLALALLVLFVLGAILFHPLVEALLGSQISRATGLPVKMDRSHFSLRRPEFSIQGLQFANPNGFPSGKIAEARLVQVRYRRLPLIVGQFRFARVEVHFKEFRLMRNEKGDLNLPKISPAPQAKATMGELVLHLDAVTYTDLSGGQPVQNTFDVRLANEVYRNVKGISGIVEIVNWEVLKRTGVGEEAKPVIPEIQPTPQPPVNPPVTSAAPQPEKTNPGVSSQS